MIQTRATINNNPRGAPATRGLVSQLRRQVAEGGPLDRFLAVERPGQKFGALRAPDWDFLAAPAARLQKPLDLYQLAATLQTQGLGPAGGREGSESLFHPSMAKGPLGDREALHGPALDKEGRDSETTEVDATDEDRAIYEGLPFFARWFSFGRVHGLERDALAEFFGDKPSKTPAVYQRVRDFIIRLYFMDPANYLTPTACRRSIAGDAGAVLRVHAFLESWGIINFRATAGRGPRPIVNDAGDFPLFGTTADPQVEKPEFLTPKAGLTGRLFEAAFERQGIQRPRCFQCQNLVGKNWWAKRDFSVVDGESEVGPQAIVVCEDCFVQEKFPVFFGPEDFEKRSLLDSQSQTLENGSQKQNQNGHEKNGGENQAVQNSSQNHELGAKSSSPFSLEEQIRLVELLQAEGEGSKTEAEKEPDWSQIAVHFPQRSEDELIAAFLRLPLSRGLAGLSESLAIARNGDELGVSSISARFSQALKNIREALGPRPPAEPENGNGDSKPAESRAGISKKVDEIFEKKLEKVSLKLRFFEEVEKSLYHEQQATKLLR